MGLDRYVGELGDEGVFWIDLRQAEESVGLGRKPDDGDARQLLRNSKMRVCDGFGPRCIQKQIRWRGRRGMGLGFRGVGADAGLCRGRHPTLRSGKASFGRGCGSCLPKLKTNDS